MYVAEASLVTTLRVNGNIGLVCREGAFGNSMPIMGGCAIMGGAAEAAAIKKAEEELKEQLRMEQVNAELEAAHKKKQDEANEKFKTAPKS